MAAEDKRRAEKKLRNAIDDLRYAIRDLEPEVEIETTYEDAKPRFEELKEYKALPDDESRRAAFDKYIARAKVCPAYSLVLHSLMLVWVIGTQRSERSRRARAS